MEVNRARPAQAPERRGPPWRLPPRVPVLGRPNRQQAAVVDAAQELTIYHGTIEMITGAGLMAGLLQLLAIYPGVADHAWFWIAMTVAMAACVSGCRRIPDAPQP